MLKKYKDFSIYYDSKSKQEFNKLMPLLENNYDFAKTILPNRISLKNFYINHYKIDDIEKYIKGKIREISQEKWVSEAKKDLSKLSSIYEQYLYHEYDEEDAFTKSKHDSTYDLSCASFIYYDDIESIYNSLTNMEEEKEKLLSYIKEHGREQLMNKLLRKCLINVDYYYPRLFTMINPIWEEIKQEKNMEIEKTNNKLSPLSYEELINNMRLFLKEMDSTGELSIIFEELLKNKELKIFESDKYSYNLSNARNGIISLYVNHNTEDFKVLAHEFSHYVTNKNVKEEGDNSYLLVEFPPFYYEEQAINFLERNGLDEEEVKTLRNIRKKYIKQATYAITDLLDLLKAKIKKDLTIEEALNIIKNNRNELNEEKLSNQLDYYINSIISSGTRVYTITSYVVAYNLTKRYDRDDKETMKEIALNLDTINPEVIINNNYKNNQYKRIL